MEELRAAFDAEKVAALAHVEALTVAFPVGSTVLWKRGNFIHSGRVLRNSYYSPQLWALNSNTGNEVKISSFDILEAGSK